MKKAFGKARVGLALVLTVAMAFTGCSTSWVQQAQAILAIALPAATNILSLVAAFSGAAVSTSDLEIATRISGEVSGDLSKIGTLIDDYSKATGPDKTAALDKVSAAVTVAQGHLDDLLAAVHVNNEALKAKIQAVVGVVVSELASIRSLISVAQGGGGLKAGRVRSAGQLKADFNATMTAPTGDATVDSVTASLAVK